ncbi:hypothetical protein BGY98DRAFT_1095066 [Russula aff. rugulosa BPL654]|nr:hypothetical protein BGY98DRAFT_1095066 [Russula aff. rugulosa BPL654]
MYPGGTDNHKKGYCADGARQIVKKGDNDSLPDWPQPQGIFEKGTHFHPIEFLKTLWEVYEKLVVDRTSGVDVPIEYLNGTVLFRLFDLTISPPHPTSSSYFMTAANTCVLIAFRDDCLAFSNCRLKV